MLSKQSKFKDLYKKEKKRLSEYSAPQKNFMGYVIPIK
ncbi:hypothetical protein IGL30_000137 [Enterococcus sp. DIV1089c]